MHSGHGPFAHGSHVSSPPAMDLKEGDYVRFKHERVETTGTVIKRSGTCIRVQPKDGGATLWKELSELLPLASFSCLRGPRHLAPCGLMPATTGTTPTCEGER